MLPPALNWWKLLPVGATACPKDKTPLHWEVLGGMRVRHQRNKGHVYNARCPKCHKDFEVLAPKEYP